MLYVKFFYMLNLEHNIEWGGRGDEKLVFGASYPNCVKVCDYHPIFINIYVRDCIFTKIAF